MLVNHGGPQPTSAPRSAGQDAPITRAEGPAASGMTGIADDSGIQSQISGQTNGSSMQSTSTNPTTLNPSSTQPNQTRTTKGKYSLSDFTLKRTLGTGSFGRVHLVQSNHNQRFYAVKVLKKAQVVKMKQVEHTNDERKMLQKVKHTFLVTLWGTFQDSKNLYMVMDFVEGGELFSLLRKSQVSLVDLSTVPLPPLYTHNVSMLTRQTAFSEPGGQVLCSRGYSCPRLSPCTRYHISRPQARKFATG